MTRFVRLAAMAAALFAWSCGNGTPQAERLNVYSARHYDSDDAIYAAFTRETGVEVNRIEAGGDLLIERVRAEGVLSPADVVVTVDAGRLWRAEQAGLFQPMTAAAGYEAVPANWRHPDNLWTAITRRARVIVYRDGAIDPALIDTYEALADPALRGRLCVRSSGNVYNLSLLAGLVERWGAQTAEDWARGVVANFARSPRGGDIDQIRAVAAGECDVALVNHYYFARMMGSADPVDRAVVNHVRLIWPNQPGTSSPTGAHVNVSGVGVAANAPRPELAERFIAFLLEDAQQTRLASGNNEYPVTDAPFDNAALEALGPFAPDDLPVQAYGERQAEAARIFDAAGWP